MFTFTLPWLLVVLGSVFVVLVTTGAVLLIVYARWHYGSLESRGFQVIKPHWLLGSDPTSYKKCVQEQDLKWAHKHGPVFAGYAGRLPTVYLTDRKLIRSIFVRDANHFYDRQDLHLGSSLMSQVLEVLRGEKWKAARASMTPIFTSARIKQLGHTLNELMDEAMNGLRERERKELKDGSSCGRLKLDFREFSIAVLAAMSYRSHMGVELQLQDAQNPNHALVQLLRSAALENMSPDWTEMLFASFPFMNEWLLNLLPDMQTIPKLVALFEQLIQARRIENQRPRITKHNDFIEIMAKMLDKVESGEFKRLGITKETVFGLGWNVLAGSHDTISLPLNMCAYHFAKDPAAQERALQEVDSKPTLDMDALGAATELPFLHACILEVLRLHPPFPRPERMCNKDWSSALEHDGTRIHVKKGMNVVVLGWAVNRDPELYPDPHAFVPDRFLPNCRATLDPYGYTSFGYGHRICPGNRLGIFATKLILARFLQEFKFQAREDTVAKMKVGWTTMLKYEPFWVDVVNRKP